MSLRPQGGMNDGACMAAKGEEASMTEREGRGFSDDKFHCVN
jgi:hypothetical protein